MAYAEHDRVVHQQYDSIVIHKCMKGEEGDDRVAVSLVVVVEASIVQIPRVVCIVLSGGPPIAIPAHINN